MPRCTASGGHSSDSHTGQCACKASTINPLTETAWVLVFGGCPRVGGEGVLALCQVLTAHWGNHLLSTHFCHFSPAVSCLSVLRIWGSGHSTIFLVYCPIIPIMPCLLPTTPYSTVYHPLVLCPTISSLSPPPLGLPNVVNKTQDGFYFYS